MEIIKDLKEVKKIIKVLKETNLKINEQIQTILNKWIKVFEDFIKDKSLNSEKQKNENTVSKINKNKSYNSYSLTSYACKCCSKKKANKNLIFLCPYPCANITKEKPTHKCLKCAKPYYPILFKKNEGWIAVSFSQLKCQQLQLNNKMLQENQLNSSEENNKSILKKSKKFERMI